ncbi:MAG: hypothetical protein ABIL40_03650 [candidate division WOR-3 bacterium]
MAFDIIFILWARLEFPMEFNGRAFLGKYLNSDTTRFNMDASVQLRCRMVRWNTGAFFMDYRDDLDMAEQKGGVSLDPRYAHYYFTAGFEYNFSKFFGQFSFIHDCIHDIDYEVSGTPVFNRFSLLVANAEYHPSRIISTKKTSLWALNGRFYPHWRYHGWDINAGADYRFDGSVDLIYNFLNGDNYGGFINLNLLVCRSDTAFYHQDYARISLFYKNLDRRIGMELKYHIYNNDPIKNPGGLWLLSIFVEF